MYGSTSIFSRHISEGTNFCDILFAILDNKSFQNGIYT